MSFDIYDYQLHFEFLAKEWEKQWPIFVYSNTYPLCSKGVRPAIWLGPMTKNSSKNVAIHWETEQRSAMSFNLFTTPEVCKKILTEIKSNKNLYYVLSFKSQLLTNFSERPLLSTVRVRTNTGEKFKNTDWVTQSGIKLEGTEEVTDLTVCNWFVTLKDWCPTNETIQDVMQDIFTRNLPTNTLGKALKARTRPLSLYNIHGTKSSKRKHKHKPSA